MMIPPKIFADHHGISASPWEDGVNLTLTGLQPLKKDNGRRRQNIAN
jgi:hypothetical protein